MLQHLRRTCHYALTLQAMRQLQITKPLQMQQQQIRRTLFGQQITKPYAATNLYTKSNSTGVQTTNATTTTTADTTEIDQDYVQPYREELEQVTKASVLVDALRQRFRLTENEVQRIINDETVQRNFKTRTVLSTLDTLCLEGVSRRSFIEHPWLLILDNTRLRQKLVYIKALYMTDINHFVPFMRLTLPRLRKLVAALNKEKRYIEHGNRVYYIAEKLQVDTVLVTKYLSKRLFILEMPYDMFEQNLQHMIDYNVSSINILKDLWAFRYTPKSVQLRLERAKRAKKDKIMPWMVRCPEPILQRSLKLTLDEIKVLGKFGSVVEYVADRLQFSVTEAKAIMDRHPQVHTVRVTKIKEVLDYLIDEAGFSRHDIAQVPRILCHSLKTTKARLNELEALGCRPSSLVILCRSKREYAKFLSQWETWAAQRKDATTHETTTTTT